MKKYFLLFILLVSCRISAQRISLCKAYTNKGEPIDLIYSASITPNQSVCVLFSGEHKKIAGTNIHLFIDKISGDQRENQLSKTFKPAKENWIAQSFRFMKDGKYEIYFTDDGKKRYSSLTALVGTVNTMKPASASGIYQYTGAELIFCERILSGRPVKIKEKFSLDKDNGTVCIYLNNKQPLLTEKVLLNIWRRSKPGLDYEEFLGIKKYEINPEWSDTFLKYSFARIGEYKIVLYDEKDILIKTAYISVTN